MKVKLSDTESVTAVTYKANRRNQFGITLLLGHGAGADQNSEFMVTFAKGLAARGVDTVTFNFLYTEMGRKAPDRPDKLEACYRAVIDAVLKKSTGNRLFIGGKSMGGRIASQVAAQSIEPVSGLIFLGYPLHPPGKPEQLRAAHLPNIGKPLLFVQGERDAFGTPAELAPVLKKLKPAATVFPIPKGDHSFGVPKKNPIPQAEIYSMAMDEIVGWLISV
ncbi:MAG: alpha/beta fold hydrolase [Acidobacteriota bacterium]